MPTTTTPVLEMVDPATLLVDRNIRSRLDLDKAMIASVKTHGVIVPITAVRDDTGGLRVRAGHRRTAAAIQAGLHTVPVVIVAVEDDTDTGQAGRIVEQIIENHHRTNVTDADTVAAVEQLAAFGVSVAAIARRTTLPKATVAAAAAVAASDAAAAALTSSEPLTLEHAAWVAEFDADPDLQTRLISELASRPGFAVHTLQRLREVRDDRNAVATVHARFDTLTWIQRPGWDDPTARLSDLTEIPLTQWPAHGLPEAITDTEHTPCPGAVAWLEDDYRHGGTDADNDDQADDGDDPLTVGQRRYRLIHGCSQPHHHTLRSHAQRGLADQAKQAAQSGIDPDDARKTERRRLIALNKAADAASVVRREWLTTFSHRKTSPKDAAVFLLNGLAHRDLPWDDLRSNGLPALRTALGVTDTYPNNPDAVTDLATTPAKAAHLHLCTVLWSYDAHIKRDSWRGPQAQQQRYLTQLAAWGYPLAEVEQIITGALTEHAAYDALTTD